MSFNFGPGDSGAYLCELSDSDHNLHPEDLQQRDGFIYGPTEVGIKVAQSKEPMSLNIIWLATRMRK